MPLILTVKPGEDVYLKMPDGQQGIVRARLHRDRLKLSFELPKNIAIVRADVMQRNNEASPGKGVLPPERC